MPLQPAITWRKNYYYSRAAAMRAVQFFERELQHVQGEHDGNKVALEFWQRRFIRRVFGWLRKSDRTRKFRKVFLFIPSGNGKSFIISGIGTYLFAGDREPGAHVVTAAADTEQAAIVYGFAKENCTRNPILKELVGKAYRRSMAILSTGSSYKVISSSAETKHGMDLHGVLVDEVHAMKNRQLIDVLMSRTRTRRQPLTMFATTAGYDKTTICGELYGYACRVRDGEIDDPEFYPIIFEAPKGADWKDEKTWYAANPNLGITVKLDFLRSQCEMAKRIPTYENTFKRIHLNIWTDSAVRWIPMDKWDQCNEVIPDENLVGIPCWAGLDMASKLDVAALSIVFKLPDNRLVTRMRFWMPEERINELEKKGQSQWAAWARTGVVVSTPGDEIDYERVRKDIVAEREAWNFYCVAYDPWNTGKLAQELQNDDDILMVPLPQTFKYLSEPSKELVAAVESRRFRHLNNPLLTWMASHAMGRMDTSGNVRPDKGKSTEKIDGILALVMAINRMLVGDQTGTSVYDNRGIIIIKS